MRILLATLLAVWAIHVTRQALARWRRRVHCCICLVRLRPAGSGEDASGPWYCGRCGLVAREVRALYAKRERRAS